MALIRGRRLIEGGGYLETQNLGAALIGGNTVLEITAKNNLFTKETDLSEIFSQHLIH